MKKIIALLFLVMMGVSQAEQKKEIMLNTLFSAEQLKINDKEELLTTAYNIAVTLLIYFSQTGDNESMDDMVKIIFIIRDLATQWGLRIKV